MKKLTLIIISFLILVPLTAQNMVSEDHDYEISEISVQVKGSTWPWALLKKIDLKKGTRLRGYSALLTFLEDRRSIMASQRVLESGEIEITNISGGDDGVYFVDLRVSVTDTFSFIILPQPKYDDNSGLTISLRARDYNFLGSMEPLRLTFEYQYDELGQNQFTIDQDYTLPFQVSEGIQAAWALSNGFNFRYEKIPEYTMNHKVTFFYDIFGHDFSTWVTQGVRLYDDIDDGSIPDWYLLNSSAGLGTAFSLLETGGLGSLTWNPSVSADWKYRLDAPVHEDRDQRSLEFEHSLNWGRLDWKGNLRQGFLAQISNGYQWQFHRDDWNRNVEALLVGAYSWSWAGVSARAKGWWALDVLQEDQGDSLRGILDNRIDADMGFSFNLDLPVQIFVARPSEWFQTPELKIIDFELQFSPIYDFGLFRNQTTGEWMAPFQGAGLEVFVFPRFFRAFYLRASVAWDVDGLLENKSLSGVSSRDGASIREIFIGIGHHY